MRRLLPALASLAALTAVTGAIFALRPVAPVVSLGVLYLLAVPVAVASMLAFNFCAGRSSPTRRGRATCSPSRGSATASSTRANPS